MAGMHDYKARFDELILQGKQVPIRTGNGGFEYVEPTPFASWKASARNLLEMTFGAQSHMTQRFVEIADPQKGSDTYALQCARGHFAGAAEEFNRGFLRSVRKEISDEFVVDLCLRAELLLEEGHLEPAAVLTAAAAEDCFRTKADQNQLYKEGNTLSDNINALKGAGLLSGAPAKIAGSLPKFRNAALHADWKATSEVEVRTVCAFLKAYSL